MEKKNSIKETNLSSLTSASSTSSYGRKWIFHKKSIDKNKKAISAISTTTTKNLKEKKIYLKPTKNTSTVITKPTKISIESVDKQDKFDKSKDNDKIKALEKELQNIKSKIGSIDKTNEEKTLILKKTNEEIESKASLLTHQKVKMEHLKEIKDILTKKMNSLKVEMDKLNQIRQEEPSPLSLNTLLSQIMMNADADSNKEDSDDSNLNPNNNNSQGLSYEELQELPVTLYDSSNEEKCVLCEFELCVNDFIIKLTKCQHVFHKECLVRFLSKSSKCPVCKQSVL